MASAAETDLTFPDPPLADDVVRLRAWSDRDIGPAHEATRDDPSIMRWTRVPEGRTEEQLREAVDGYEPARLAGESLALVIADAADDGFLGAISLFGFAWEDRRAEIGYWVAPWARGRGVARRAVGLLGPWALRTLELERLALRADHDNPASQRVAERAGFTREGVLRSIEERKGIRRDLVVYSLIPADLEARG